MPSGRVKFFNTDRAYGFIAPDDGSSDVFVYVHDVEAAHMKILVAGQLVDTRSASREMAAQRPSSLACLTPRMPHSRRQLLAKAAIAALRGGISLSFQLDLAFDLVRQADAAERNRARGREFLVALELALRQGLADGLLDLALRAYPQHLEKFANAAVKDVFVHDRLLC